MISLSKRMRMAFLAFRCKPFEIFVEPYHKVDELKSTNPCDNKDRALSPRWGCQGQGEVCMSRTIAEFKVKRDYDHEHICGDCAAAIEGSYGND
ncbi:hypothetical protein ES703_75543 [subsurface metagenome]